MEVEEEEADKPDQSGENSGIMLDCEASSKSKFIDILETAVLIA